MSTSDKQQRARPRGKTCWADRTDEILDAAAVVFATHGYQDTEMQLIAEALGIGKGTIYLYFPSKEDLFLRAVRRGMERLSLAVEESGANIEDPIERLVRAIHAYLAFYHSHPQYTELLIQERAQFRDGKQSTYFAHCENVAEHWKNHYAELIAAGRLRDIPVSRILDVINDLLYGTMFTNYFSRRHKPLETQARDLVDVFFNGILSDAERRHSDNPPTATLKTDAANR